MRFLPLFYFLANENKIKPIPNMINVMGQGSGSPRGLGLFRIIKVESTISRNPDTMKHNFDTFNMNTAPLIYFLFFPKQQICKSVPFMSGYLSATKTWVC